MSNDSMTDAVLAHADTIESRLGPPGPDPSLEHIPLGTDPLVHQIVYSMLLWESSHEMAARCIDVVRQSVVDFNELRVCSGLELHDMIPRECPQRGERSSRLLAALNAIFLREHGLSMAAVSALPKREARQYLDSIDGLPQFAIARVMLLTLGGHAFPADDRICQLLRDAGVIESDGAGADEVGIRLERAVRAADSPRVYALIEAEAASSAANGTAGSTRKRGSKRSASTSTDGNEP